MSGQGAIHIVAVALRLTGCCLAMLLLAMISAHESRAQSQPQTFTAVVSVAPPFVIKNGDQFTGFSIDLWNAVAAKLNLKTVYKQAADLDAEFAAMRAKQADILVVPAYYTVDLDKEFDFSYPILNAGFLVVVRDTGETTTDNPLLDLAGILISPVLLMWLGFVIIFILLPAHLFWFLDRGSEESISPEKGYFPGILHAMVWSATALVSQVQQLPRHSIARALGLVWMFVGVVFIAFYTAQMTANLTVQQIRGAINGPQDLQGKRVAALADSHASTVAKELGAKVHNFLTEEEVFDALETHKVAAAIMNAPIARYYSNHEGAGKVVTVGDEFHRHDLGYLEQLNSPMRRPIDDTLMGLMEDGTYDVIYNKWFGGS